MIDKRALMLTALLFLTLYAVPMGAGVILGPVPFAVLALLALGCWVRLVPAMPGFLQGVIFVQGAILLFSNLLRATVL